MLIAKERMVAMMMMRRKISRKKERKTLNFSVGRNETKRREISSIRLVSLMSRSRTM